MNPSIPITYKDLIKNIQGVSLDDILATVKDCKMSTKSIVDESNKIKGLEVKLVVKTDLLNPEELSLLKDSSPNAQYSSGSLSCSWRLSKRFAEENKERLFPLMVGRLEKEVAQVYETRKEISKSGDRHLGTIQMPLTPEKPGLWGRLIRGIGAHNKDYDSSPSLG